MKEYLFTSESVGVGHPDKVSDQISDAILDECLKQDPNSRVAVETLVTTQFVALAGEITTKASVDYEKIARDMIREIGYTDKELGFDYVNAEVIVKIHQQSPDISQGVTETENKEQGAGDQGLMFGYATNETEEMIPLPLKLSHDMVRKAKEFREYGEMNYLRPDCKSQVTFKYRDDKPDNIDSIVLSLNHDANISMEKLKQDAMEKIIIPVCRDYLAESTKIFINPTGRFVIGGPNGDTGVTGRKIIVDSYGGFARHGGGAFSGKDPSKVDRSGAYMARWIAKNLVSAGFCDRCEIQISYCIGKAEPLNIYINTFGTEKIPNEKIISIIERVFDLRPKAIIESLQLKKPIYKKTASFGHFGNSEYPWEKCNRVEELRNFIVL
jgi:S-adenosylmethionine synthetase